MSFAAESQAPGVEILALEVELFSPEAELVVEVAQILLQVVGNSGSLQTVEVEQTVETAPAVIGPLHPLKVGEGIASEGLQSQLAKLSQEQLVQLAVKHREKMTGE